MSNPILQVGLFVAQVALSAVSSLLASRGGRNGPKLNDERRRILSSAYGENLPVVFGRQRIGGNIIWGRKFDETPVKVSAGKGFGASGVEYVYHADFAVALCEGEVETLDRIWADGQVIYDAASDEPEASSMQGLQFRFYTGSEDQEPDPLIQQYIDAEHGSGSTPAYRGTAYVVFEQLPVGPFGKRVPQLEFLVTRNADPVTRISRTIDATGAPQPNDGKFRIAYDRQRNIAYMVTGEGTVTTEQLVAADMRTGDVVVERDLTDIMAEAGIDTDTGAINLVAGSVGPYLLLQRGSTWSGPKVLVDKRTLSGLANIGEATTGQSTSETEFPDSAQVTIVPMTDALGATEYFIFGGYRHVPAFGTGDSPLWGINVPKVFSFMEYFWGKDYDLTSPGLSLKGVAVTPQTGPGASRDVFFGVRDASLAETGTLRVLRGTLLPGAFYDEFNDQTIGFDDPVLIWTAPATANGIVTMAWDDTEDLLIIGDGQDTGGNGATYAIQRDGTQVWSKSYHAVRPFPDQLETTIAAGVFAARGPGDSIRLIDTATGDDVSDFTWAGDTFTDFTNPDGDVAQWDPVYGRAYLYETVQTGGKLAVLYGERNDAEPEPLPDVVAAIATRSRLLSASDIDVTGLTGTVSGYTIRQGSIRDALEPLAAAYNFDVAEIDGKLTAIHRDGTSDVTVTDDDLVDRGGEDGEPVEETRGGEIEAPLSVTVSYINADMDWQISSQQVRRAGGPDASVSSSSEVNIDIPLTLSDDEAIAAAQRLLYASWLEREQVKFSLPQSFLRVVPTDVVSLTMLGQTALWRADRVAVGANNVVEIEGRRTADYIYPVQVTSIAGDGVTPGFVPLPAALVFPILMDAPFLQDVDAQATGVGLVYSAMAREAGQTNAYRVSTLRVSEDGGETFADKAQHDLEATWGVFETALPDIPDPGFNAIQHVTARVSIANGSTDISSVTAAQMIGDLANVCAIVAPDGTVEIAQFQTATDNADGTFDLTDWLRGRRGTEVFATGRSPGDRFVLLDRSTIKAYSVPSGALGRTDLFAAANNRQSEDDFREAITYAVRALLPYAPAHITAEADGGDIDIAWVRRTRLGGDWLDGTGTVPLSEDSEAYQVEVYDTDGTTLLRTYESTTEALTYPSADVAADFGSVPSSVHLRVRQVSEQVGPGLGIVQEIEVTA